MVDEEMAQYGELIDAVLQKTFRITDKVFLKDCYDTGRLILQKECRMQLHYVNKKFRERLRSCK